MRCLAIVAATLAIWAGCRIADADTQLSQPIPATMQVCGTVLGPDTLVGSVGTATPCVPRSDATRPTTVQAAIVSTDATGAWTVTWAKPFVSAAPYINPQAVNPANVQPYICNITSSTATGATGKCWQTVTMTLPSVLTSLTSLVLNPTGAAPSIQVRVAAREATQ